MYRLAFFVFIFVSLFLTGCKPSQRKTTIDADGKERIHITLQTDWYAQPEHGGYYQALVKGYYADEGLDVEIIPGGLRCANMEKTGMNEVDFSIGRSDDVMVRIARGVPLTIIGIEMQHDPTALFFHPSQKITSLRDLDGRTIKAGMGMIWTQLLKKQLNIDFTIVPTGNGFGEFLQNETLLQQGFATNEPFFLEKQGAKIGILLLYQGGSDTYRVIISSSRFAQEHPEIVLAFVRASLKGWKSFLTEDPSQAFERIAEHNHLMKEPGYMEFSRKALIAHNLIGENIQQNSRIGQISLERVHKEIEALKSIEALDSELQVKDVVHVPTFEKLELLDEKSEQHSVM